MTCQQAEPLLARAADGTLDADRGAALALHLDACAGCRDALDAQRAMRELLAARPEATVPVGFATRVVANLPPREHPLNGWLDALNWRAWTLRLAPVAGALFVGAALGLGPTEAAEAGTFDAEVVSAWMTEEAAEGEAQDPRSAATLDRLWHADESTDDPLLDVLLVTDPQGSLSVADEAGR